MSRPVLYGGQAVIEGVMMKGPDRVAVAVRRPDREIAVHVEPISPLVRRHRWLNLPVLRGVIVLGETLSLGMSALIYSANEQTGEERPIGRGEVALTVAAGLGLAILLFIVAPTLLINWLERLTDNPILLNLVEGAVRVAILIGYVWSIAFLPDIRRVLQYHGAEHKVIHAHECGGPMTVEAVREKSPLHPRCGTSFLLFVVVVSIGVFAFLGWPAWYVRIIGRLATLPIVAGLAYELIRITAAYPTALLAWLVKPGLWLQTFTTREPDDEQIEVALRAFEAAGDPS